jgi:large subunit ribosomal protein L30
VDIKITLTKSAIGAIPKHRKTVQALGLKKTGRSVVKRDDPAIRGMIKQVEHLVTVTEA